MPPRREGCPRGKLKAAARRWAGARGGGRVQADDALTAQSRMPKWTQSKPDDVLELVEDEADAVALFQALGTQWRRCAFTGARLGVDYAAIEPVARMLSIDVTPRLFTDLRIMEDAAVAQMAKRR